MSGYQRLFIALAPSEVTRLALVQLRDSLRCSPPARPVSGENLHLTLAFLGPVAVARQDELLRLLQNLPELSGELRLDTLGAFPRAGVVWAGCDEIPPLLEELVECLRLTLCEHGFVFDDQPFRPHVTLWRKAKGPVQRITPPILWPMASPVLYASVSTPQGVQYRVIRSV